MVASGLAAGIDAAAHTATLDAGGRTLAVIGTGVDRVYPAAHARLQRTIAERGAVISCFWPDQAPTRQSFPLRNGVMSGLTLRDRDRRGVGHERDARPGAARARARPPGLPGHEAARAAVGPGARGAPERPRLRIRRTRSRR